MPVDRLLLVPVAALAALNLLPKGAVASPPRTMATTAATTSVIDPESGFPSRWVTSNEPWGQSEYEAIYNHYVRNDGAWSPSPMVTEEKPHSKSLTQSREVIKEARETKPAVGEIASVSDTASSNEKRSIGVLAWQFGNTVSQSIKSQFEALQNQMSKIVSSVKEATKNSTSKVAPSIKSDEKTTMVKRETGKIRSKASKSTHKSNEKTTSVVGEAGTDATISNTAFKPVHDLLAKIEYLFTYQREVVLLVLAMASMIVALASFGFLSPRRSSTDGDIGIETVLIDVGRPSDRSEEGSNGNHNNSGARSPFDASGPSMVSDSHNHPSMDLRLKAEKSREAIMADASRRIAAAKKAMARSQAQKIEVSSSAVAVATVKQDAVEVETEFQELTKAGDVERVELGRKVMSFRTDKDDAHLPNIESNGTSADSVDGTSSNSEKESSISMKLDNPAIPMLAIMSVVSAAVESIALFMEPRSARRRGSVGLAMACGRIAGEGKQLQVSTLRSDNRKTGRSLRKRPFQNENEEKSLDVGDVLLAPLVPFVDSSSPDLAPTTNSKYDPLNLLLKHAAPPQSGRQRYDFVFEVLRSIADRQSGPNAVLAGRYDMVHSILTSLGPPFDRSREKFDPIQSFLHSALVLEEWGPQPEHDFPYDPFDGVLIGSEARDFWETLDDWGRDEDDLGHRSFWNRLDPVAQLLKSYDAQQTAESYR